MLDKENQTTNACNQKHFAFEKKPTEPNDKTQPIPNSLSSVSPFVFVSNSLSGTKQSCIRRKC